LKKKIDVANKNVLDISLYGALSEEFKIKLENRMDNSYKLTGVK